jgi:hypothetical protein
MILSTKVDSSEDQRPVRHVLETIDRVAAGLLFFSVDNPERSCEGGLAFEYPLSCARERNASSNRSVGSGKRSTEAIGAMEQDGHIALVNRLGNRISNGRQVCVAVQRDSVC